MTVLPRPDHLITQAKLERFERLRPIVQGMAQRMRPADEDMLSIGITKLWEMVRFADDQEDPYLIAAARNAMIDRIRYHRVREMEKRITEVCGLEDALVSKADAEELPLDILDVLTLLPQHLRRAFELHCLREYTLEETAARLHRPVSTVAFWVTKAKRLLRQELQ